MTQEKVSDAVASHIAGLSYEDLPPQTVKSAKYVLLDALGVMLAASGLSQEVRPFVDLVRASGQGPCTILGTGYSSSPAGAALANGAMAHALDFEDAFDLAPGHPNASLVPSLIALAQMLEANGRPVSGKEFLTALAAGGDLACRIALALDRPMEDGNWYPPPITAGMGAAAGAAKLLNLNARGVRDSLSLALCQVTMPGEIKYSRDTVLRAVREAFPAQSAVQSALLAETGITGFEHPLEGLGGFYALYAGGQYSSDRLLDRMGQFFWIEQLTFKPWPSCRGTHPFIEAALALRDQVKKTDAITCIEVAIDPMQTMLVEPVQRKQAPGVIIDAKFSIPFCVALALVRGRVTLDDFSQTSLSDPDVLSVARKVNYQVAPQPQWQRGSGGSMRVSLRNGKGLTANIDCARGAPSNPLTETELIEKFVNCAGRAVQNLSVLQVENIARSILSLEAVPSVSRLFS
ncbi:MAG: MmgE/PrpD family protein [Sphingomonadaceae bacterium]